MIAPRTRGRVYLQSFMGALITFSTFWACLFVFILLWRSHSDQQLEELGAALFYSVTALAAVMAQGLRTIFSQPEWWAPSWRASRRLSRSQVAWVAVALCVALVAIGDITTSRVFLGSWLLLLYAALLLANRFLPSKIVETVHDGRAERTVLLGNVESVGALAGWRERQEKMGAQIFDFISDYSISDMANLERLMRERNVTQLILLELPEVKFNLHYVMEICERVGVRLLLWSPLEEVFRHRISVADEGGVRFVTLEDEPLERPQNRFLKRMMDVAVTLVLVALLWPFLLLVWIAVRFSSKGPGIAREPRVGLKGEGFTILKFRTRGLDGSEHSLGQWLCRTSIDELPQLWNVLRGEMSLVGPRAHWPEQSEVFARVMRNYHVRSDVKPGITGLAQVRGLRGRPQSEEEIARRVAADVEYVQNWSLGLDLMILWKTLWLSSGGRKKMSPERSHV